jgi:type IV pilus assembly protein PilY1
MDITDPEQPPVVLGEIVLGQNVTGNFALGSPAFSVHRESDGKRHFLLTFGSGPADDGGPIGTSNKPVSAPAGGSLSAWVYDLAQVAAQNSTPVASLTTTSVDAKNSFAGDMVATDFDLNYSAEGVYFGVVTNPLPPTGTPPVNHPYTGGLWKVNMNTGTSPNLDTSDPGSWRLTEVINTGQPVHQADRRDGFERSKDDLLRHGAFIHHG